MIPKIVLILGTMYTGKTYAAGYLARALNRPFIIIVHTHPDESYRIRNAARNTTRWIAVRAPACTVSPHLLRETRRHHRYLYFSIYDLSTKQTQIFFASLAAAIRQVGNLGLFIDEAHLFCRYQLVGDDFIGFVRGSRHFGVDVVLVTHRLRDIDVGIRCVITHMVLFRTTEENDIELLARELGMKREDALKVRQLPDRQHLFVDRRTNYISPSPQQI